MVRRAFEHAATTYDEAAVLQREVGDRMAERLDLIRISPTTILDVGAGTGYSSHELIKRYPGAEIVALDIAKTMLDRTCERCTDSDRLVPVCADMEAMPFIDESMDMIYSNLTLQWCNDVEHTLQEFKRLLKPGGVLMLTTFGPDTLNELRTSWATVDDYEHVHAFIDMHDIGDAMVRAGFAQPVLDAERITLTYSDVRSLMNDLKGLGAHNVAKGRTRGLTGPQRLAAMTAAYEKFRTDDRLPATYEVVYGHAWCPDAQSDDQQASALQAVSVSSMREAMYELREQVAKEAKTLAEKKRDRS